MLIPVALICVGQSGLDFFGALFFFDYKPVVSQEPKRQLTKNIVRVPRCADKDAGTH